MSTALSNDDLDQIVDEQLGARVESILFSWSHLSDVRGVRLRSGEEVVVKLRPWVERLDAAHRVHVAAFELGVPCPEIVTGLSRFRGDGALTIERYAPQGELLPRGDRQLRSSAQALAQTVDRLSVLPATDPTFAELHPVPWLDWHGAARWPAPDDVDVDLNAVSAGGWIDEIGRLAAQALDECALRQVVGHGDFESSNVLFHDDGSLAMLHDWDSAVRLPEACLVGAAALVFPANNEPVCSSVEQTNRYLEEYQSAREITFNEEEHRAAWAAGTWQLAFNAKKENARGDRTPLGDALSEQRAARLARLSG